MPLTELPPSHIAHNGRAEQHQKLPYDDSPRTGTPNGPPKQSSMPNPSSVQSMLRNTTEMGNVGQFSVKPPNISRSTQGSSSRNRATPQRNNSYNSRHNGSNNGSPAGHRNGHHHMNDQYSPALSRSGTIASNPGAGLHPHSQGLHRGPSQVHPFDDYRSYSMTQSSYISHSLIQRKPHANDSRQPPRDGYFVRPRSPFAYPTRLKRPGYRPSSPALSSGSGLDRGPSSRTTSPVPMHTPHRMPSPWQQSANRSDPPLRYYPSPPGAGPMRLQSPPPWSSQPPTPQPRPSLRSAASLSRLPRSSGSANGPWIPAQASTQSPLFYDYTEEFEDEYSFPHRSMSTTNLTEPPIPEDDLNLRFKLNGHPCTSMPVELPVQGLPLATGPSFSNLPSVDGLLRPRSGRNNLIEPAKKTGGTVPSVSVMDFDNCDHAAPGKSQQKGNEANSTSDIPILETTAQHLVVAPLSPKKVPNNPPEGLSDDASSSSIDSVFSAKASPQKEKHDGTDSTLPTVTTLALDKARSETPVKKFHRAISINSQRSSSPRPLFESRSTPDHTEIFSPTPERSMKSPSSRDRFSKILSIDDGLFALDQSAEISQKGDSRSGKVGRFKSKVPSPQPSLQLQESLASSNAIEHSIEEEPGSKDEHGFTNGLLQMFGKPRPDSDHDLDSSSSVSQAMKRANRDWPMPFIMKRTPAAGRSTWASSVRSESPSSNTVPQTEMGHGEAAAARERDLNLSSSAFESSLPHTDKELPALPEAKHSMVAIAPPAESVPTGLPCAFAPLVRRRSEDDSVSEAPIHLPPQEDGTISDLKDSFGLEPKRLSDRISTASPANSRPWNLDASYPWSDQPPELEVTMPKPAEEPTPTSDRFPRFKLRIHRTSSSTVGTGKTSKARHSLDDSSSSRRNTHDPIQATLLRRKLKAKLSAGPDQINSSHDIIGSSPIQTRFVEAFEDPSRVTSAVNSPTITLLPPSPGHEVQSFFSDDSSQMLPRGSFRKRFSDFRARNTKSTSVDENRGIDRGLLSSPFGRSRASGRSSRQSHATGGATSCGSHRINTRWKVIEKLRSWWRRNEARFHDWSRTKRQTDASRGASAEPYEGV